jgi:NADH-quinone oxidoreductase subunit J
MLKIAELLIFFFLCFFALNTCCGQNVIFSLLSFIGVIINLVCLLLLHGVEFLSLVFLIIYIGAIVVLFLFVIFIFNLTAQSDKNYSLYTADYSKYNLILLIIVVILFAPFLIFFYSKSLLNDLLLLETLLQFYSTDLIFFFEKNDIDLIGFFLYSDYKVLFIISGFLLLIAMVGSVVLVKNNINKK